MRTVQKGIAFLLSLLFFGVVFAGCAGAEPDYNDPDLDVSSLSRVWAFKYYVLQLTDHTISTAAEQFISSGGKENANFAAMSEKFTAFGTLVQDKFGGEKGAKETAAYLKAVGSAFSAFSGSSFTDENETVFKNQIAVAKNLLAEKSNSSELMQQAYLGADFVNSGVPTAMTIVLNPSKRDANTMLLTFGGNTFLGNPADSWEDGFNKAYSENKSNPYYPFENCLQYFLQDDLTLVSYAGSFSKTDGKANGYNGLPEYATAMARCGIDVVCLNSEHAGDFYAQGLTDTDSVFKNAGIQSYYDQKTQFIETKLGKLALISYNIVSTKAALRQIIRTDIEQANANGAKIIIVNFHWGSADAANVTATQQTWAEMATTYGADLVIGSHPHKVQGIAYSDIGRGMFYSLGDLCNGADTANKYQQGCLVQVTVKKNGSRYSFTDYHVIPIVRKDTETTKFLPAIATGTEKQEVLDAILASSRKLNGGIQKVQ